MVRFLLIAAALSGCYRPSLVDCRVTCDELDLCPSGLSCVQGFCTSGTSCMPDASTVHDSWLVDVELAIDAHDTDAAVDALATDAVAMADAAIDGEMIDAGVDAMVDAALDAQMIDAEMLDAAIDAQMIDAAIDAPMIDAMIDAQPIDAAIDAPPDALVADAPTDAAMCPMPPPMGSGCMLPAATMGTPPFCYVLCTNMVTANTATSFAVTVGAKTWRAAIIDDPSGAEETAALSVIATLGTGDAWIALQQSTATLPGSNWHWYNQPTTAFTYMAWASGQPDDAGGGENQQEDCGAIGAAGWYDESCTTSRPFLIEPF